MDNNFIEENQDFNKKLSIETDIEKLKTILEDKISLKSEKKLNDKEKALRALEEIKKNKNTLSKIVNDLHGDVGENSKIMKIIKDLIEDED